MLIAPESEVAISDLSVNGVPESLQLERPTEMTPARKSGSNVLGLSVVILQVSFRRFGGGVHILYAMSGPRVPLCGHVAPE
jgi:hypothetical protein